MVILFTVQESPGLEKVLMQEGVDFTSKSNIPPFFPEGRGPVGPRTMAKYCLAAGVAHRSGLDSKQ